MKKIIMLSTIASVALIASTQQEPGKKTDLEGLKQNLTKVEFQIKTIQVQIAKYTKELKLKQEESKKLKYLIQRGGKGTGSGNDEKIINEKLRLLKTNETILNKYKKGLEAELKSGINDGKVKSIEKRVEIYSKRKIELEKTLKKIKSPVIDKKKVINLEKTKNYYEKKLNESKGIVDKNKVIKLEKTKNYYEKKLNESKKGGVDQAKLKQIENKIKSYSRYNSYYSTKIKAEGKKGGNTLKIKELNDKIKELNSTEIKYKLEYQKAMKARNSLRAKSYQTKIDALNKIITENKKLIQKEVSKKGGDSKKVAYYEGKKKKLEGQINNLKSELEKVKKGQIDQRKVSFYNSRLKDSQKQLEKVKSVKVDKRKVSYYDKKVKETTEKINNMKSGKVDQKRVNKYTYYINKYDSIIKSQKDSLEKAKKGEINQRKVTKYKQSISKIENTIKRLKSDILKLKQIKKSF